MVLVQPFHWLQPSTTPLILPPAPIIGLVRAPSSGANPKPPVDPRDTTIPPLGSCPTLTSALDVNKLLDSSLIPLNLTVLTPALRSSRILKLLLGLLTVEGVWNIPLIKRIPLPPVVPIPAVLAPPTLNENEVVIPLK